jgi:hypothetical protein
VPARCSLSRGPLEGRDHIVKESKGSRDIALFDEECELFLISNHTILLSILYDWGAAIGVRFGGVPAFNVEFYKPQLVNARGVSFSDLLDRIAAMNAVDCIRRGNDPAAILALQRQQHEFIGEAARIKMEDLPSVIDTANGNRHDLNVGVHEGLGGRSNTRTLRHEPD